MRFWLNTGPDPPHVRNKWVIDVPRPAFFLRLSIHTQNQAYSPSVRPMGIIWVAYQSLPDTGRRCARVCVEADVEFVLVSWSKQW